MRVLKGLRWLHSRIDCSLNILPLYITVSRNVVSVSEISAVNLIVGWCELACSMNCSMSGLLISHSENMSSMQRFQTVGFETFLLRICGPPCCRRCS